jgi:hypothetical protein
VPNRSISAPALAPASMNPAEKVKKVSPMVARSTP